MKINNITATDYQVNGDTLTIWFDDPRAPDALIESSLTATLVVTTDDGDVVETLDGWPEAVSLTKDLASPGAYVLVRRKADKLTVLVCENKRLLRDFATLESEATEQEKTLERAIKDARRGAISRPKSNGAWNSGVFYARNNTCTDGDIAYIALKPNRNKRPSRKPGFWAIKPPPTRKQEEISE